MKKEKNQLIPKIIITIFLLCCVIAIFILAKYTNKIELTQLTNSTQRQMMGYVIKTKTGKVVIIDGGTTGDSDNVKNYIQALGGKVDIWFLTHPHSDHAGAFVEIVENTNIEIDKIYMTANPVEWYQEYASERVYEAEDFYRALGNDRIKDKVEEVALNQQIKIDNVKCEILGVKNPEITTNAFNNSSMVIKMQVNDTSLLILGDTGVESSQKLLKTQADKLKANLVQVAHHGQAGATKELYEKIAPKICLWPTPTWLWDNDNGGGENSGDWKTMETRQWMQELKVQKNIVEKDGNITISVY